MVEVFKTNVEDLNHAKRLIDQIHKTFPGYKANFDLQDCDNILRVENKSGEVHPVAVIDLLKDFGFNIEILPDDTQVVNQILFRRQYQ